MALRVITTATTILKSHPISNYNNIIALKKDLAERRMCSGTEYIYFRSIILCQRSGFQQENMKRHINRQEKKKQLEEIKWSTGLGLRYGVDTEATWLET